MVLAKLSRPVWECRLDLPENRLSAFQFDAVALSVVETDGLDMLVPLEGPRQASRGVLTTRKENQCALMHSLTHY